MNLHLHPYKLQRYINSFHKNKNKIKKYVDPMCVFLLLETFEVILILFLRIYIHTLRITCMYKTDPLSKKCMYKIKSFFFSG